MPGTDEDFALFSSQLKAVEDAFTEFRERRRDWALLRQRRAKIVIDEALTKYQMEIQSPVLEWAAGQFQIRLDLNSTKVDVVDLEGTTDSARDIEDLRIWIAADYMVQNRDRRLDRHRHRGQVVDGVAIERKHWRAPPEPEEDEEREESFAQHSGKWFTTSLVAFDEVSWWPLEEPEIVFQNVTIPYVEARKLENDAGERLTLDAYRKVAFLGGANAYEDSAPQTMMPDIHLVIRDAKDPKTGRWEVTEVVYPAGADLARDGRKLRSYPNPLGRSMYFVTPSGNEDTSERTDPHLRYRPHADMMALYVFVNDENYLETLIASLAHKKVSDEDVVARADSLTPELISAMRAQGMIDDNTGQMIRLNLGRPGGAGLPLSPELQRWPNDLEPHLLLMLQEIKTSIARHMPNPFLIGSAFAEAAQGTAQANVNQQQAAGIPFGAHLLRSDGTTRDAADAELAAILYWDAAAPKGALKSYPLDTTGDEPVFGKAVDSGKRVSIDAAKVKRKHQIHVFTRNETQSEKQLNDTLAYQDYDRHTIPFPQLLERLGHDDPQKQIRELNKERHLIEARAQFAEAEQVERAVLWSALTGEDLGRFAGLEGGQQGPEEGGGGSSASPSGPAVGPTVTPTPMGAPQAGTNPAGGADFG